VQWSIWNFPFKLCRDPSPSSTYMEHHSPCNCHKGKAPSGICPKVHAFQSSQTCTATTTAAATATAAATSAGRRRSQEAQVCKLEEYGPSERFPLHNRVCLSYDRWPTLRPMDLDLEPVSRSFFDHSPYHCFSHLYSPQVPPSGAPSCALSSNRLYQLWNSLPSLYSLLSALIGSYVTPHISRMSSRLIPTFILGRITRTLCSKYLSRVLSNDPLLFRFGDPADHKRDS
jgi:hypothetical protein